MRIPTSNGLVRIPGRFYQVQFGDSLYSISQKFDIAAEQLLSFNDQILSDNTIFPGEMLFIPTPQHLAKTKRIKKTKKKK
jgi:LysM repeat protein